MNVWASWIVPGRAIMSRSVKCSARDWERLEISVSLYWGMITENVPLVSSRVVKGSGRGSGTSVVWMTGSWSFKPSTSLALNTARERSGVSLIVLPVIRLTTLYMIMLISLWKNRKFQKRNFEEKEILREIEKFCRPSIGWVSGKACVAFSSVSFLCVWCFRWGVDFRCVDVGHCGIFGAWDFRSVGRLDGVGFGAWAKDRVGG